MGNSDPKPIRLQAHIGGDDPDDNWMGAMGPPAFCKIDLLELAPTQILQLIYQQRTSWRICVGVDFSKTGIKLCF